MFYWPFRLTLIHCWKTPNKDPNTTAQGSMETILSWSPHQAFLFHPVSYKSLVCEYAEEIFKEGLFSTPGLKYGNIEEEKKGAIKWTT